MIRRRWGFEAGTLGQRWYWGKRFKRARVQVSLTILRHQYHQTPDRWVIQPVFVYDRKRKTGDGKNQLQR